MRTSKIFKETLTPEFKKQLLIWANEHNEVVWLDSNLYSQKHKEYEAILAVDAFTSIQTDWYEAFQKLEEYQTTTSDWIFGYLSYDLKNDTENLSSSNYDGLKFPELFFFQPKKIFLIQKESIEVLYLNFISEEVESDWNLIRDIDVSKIDTQIVEPVLLQNRVTKEEYLRDIAKMKHHIQLGDIYEANYCMEYFATSATLNPLSTYIYLNEISESPFATYFKNNSHFALSASPERYIKKKGSQVVSQPIKGTARRAKEDEVDKLLKFNLQEDPKERSENIMITDLVRNDLSKVAEKNSVQVTELCEAYTFKQVHQLISTIECTVPSTVSSVKILRESFPMGSMTGAPKVSAMKICESLEKTKRGLYSGTIGYFTPQGDFDFNVIIRSILYNSKEQYVSCSVGGAITIQSQPESEYDECLVKVKALKQALEISKQ